MDEKKLAAEQHALNWETHYRRRDLGMDIDSAFLPELVGLDDDFAAALADLGVRRGRLLELGAGSGSQAIEYARMGFDVRATDVSDTALRLASARASACSVPVRFVNDNILYTRLHGRFDIIADRGCYTILPRDHLERYAMNVSRLLRPDGFLLLKLDRRRMERMEHLHGSFDVVCAREAHYQDGSVEGETAYPAMFYTLRLNESARRGRWSKLRGLLRHWLAGNQSTAGA